MFLNTDGTIIFFRKFNLSFQSSDRAEKESVFKSRVYIEELKLLSHILGFCLVFKCSSGVSNYIR